MSQVTARSRAVVAAACWIAIALIGPPARATSGWSYASSAHFEVYTSGNEKHAREAIADFERVHAFFAHILNLPPSSAPRTRLVIFSTAREFAPYKPNQAANAFYQNAPDGDFVVMQSLNADAMPVVVHEYAHLMMRRAGVDYPLWLNEGFAEFYSTMTPEGSKMRLGLVPPLRMATLAMARSMIPLDRLFAIDTRSPEYNDQNVAPLFYAESWALTHMLLAHEQYRDRSAALLAAIAHGTPTGEALQAVYGKTVAAVGADLQNYLLRYRFAYTLADAPAASGDALVASKPADDVDVEITLASMAGWQRDREEQSRAALAALDSRAPQNLHLAEARGLLEMYTQHGGTARPYLAKAIALGSTNATILRSYASLITESDPRQAEALLTQAATLAPDDIDVHIDLARMLIEHRRGAEAMAALAAVTRVPRDRSSSFFKTLAMAALEAGRIDDARAAAARATGTARTDAEYAQAEALMREAESAHADREVRGRLTNVMCGNGPVVLEVTTDTAVLRLVIDNPRDVVAPEGAGTVDMNCGEQNRPVRVAYAPLVDAAHNTVGAVKLIEFLR